MEAPTFSKFYQRWLGAGRTYTETLANCANCTMVTRGEFLPDLKCCTYFPFLPNFSLGAILQEADENQLRALERAIERGRLSPLGLFESDSFSLLRQEAGPNAFGRKAELRCPFFEDGGCVIWTYRPAVCASYYCQSERADSWRKIEASVNQFEWTLAHEVLWRMGFTADETRRMEREAAWFEHADDQLELLRRAYRIACEIQPPEILELLGSPMLEQ